MTRTLSAVGSRFAFVAMAGSRECLLVESSVLEVLEALHELFAGVHDEGSVVSDGLLDGGTGDDKEARGGGFRRGNFDNVTGVLEHDNTGHGHISDALGDESSFGGVDEEGVTFGDGKLQSLSLGHAHVQKHGLDGDTSDGSNDVSELAGDEADGDAVGASEFDGGDGRGVNVLVARLLHLVLRREVDPQLVAPHETLGLHGSFRVNESATGGHPLHAATGQVASVTTRILMLEVTVKHNGDSFEATVRVFGETGLVILGLRRAKGNGGKKSVLVGANRGGHGHLAEFR